MKYTYWMTPLLHYLTLITLNMSVEEMPPQVHLCILDSRQGRQMKCIPSGTPCDISQCCGVFKKKNLHILGSSC